MCKTVGFTQLSFPLGRQGEHVIHDAWIQLRDSGRLTVGSIPFVLENDNDFFPLLDGQILDPVASELRPSKLLCRDGCIPDHNIVIPGHNMVIPGLTRNLMQSDYPSGHALNPPTGDSFSR